VEGKHLKGPFVWPIEMLTDEELDDPMIVDMEPGLAYETRWRSGTEED
jgi:hypothetical protein